MEKFTVDLDKVLDEFEFSEEQAFHQENFQNENLSAKIYQKPHFQPIKVANADFSPSIETLPFSTHNRKYSQDSINSASSNNIPFNSKNNEIPVIYAGLLDAIEVPAVINSQNINKNWNEIENVNRVDCLPNDEVSAGEYESVHDDDDDENDENDDDNEDNEDEDIDDDEEEEEEEEEEYDIEEEARNEDNDDEDRESDSAGDHEGKEKEEKEVEMEVVNIHSESNSIKEDFNSVERNSINIDIIPEKICEISNCTVEESQTKPDLIGSECANEEEQEKNVKLPDLTDTIKENCIVTENKIENFDLISNKQQSIDQIKEKGMFENCLNESQPPSSFNTEDKTIKDNDLGVKPIRFESQNDITDEDLHRYLEELEEEEERSARCESKPIRPDFLNLNDKNVPEKTGSPGLTPLTRNGVSVENLCSEKYGEENKANEFREVTYKETDFPSASEHTEDNESETETASSRPTMEPPLTIEERRLGKVCPFWMPDHFASNCMDCDGKFTVIRRRHHCRACGRILCSKCCGMRASLEYLENQEHRVCSSCFHTLAKVMMYELQYAGEYESSPTRRPNPNNPMEYCSTVPPPLQVSSSSSLSPPSVLVPVGVLKREGTSKVKENTKQVIFSDGIRPGGDLTELDSPSEQRIAFRRGGRTSKKAGTPPGNPLFSPTGMLPPIDPISLSFILENSLPPVCIINKGEKTYQENWAHDKLIERLRDQSLPPLTFAVNRHLIVSLKIVKMECCMNKTCWVFCTNGMEGVGQDEIIILLALKDETDDVIPRDIFLQLHYIHREAARGNTINELGCWCVLESTFLDSPDHGGFLFIRPTFQCLNHIETPPLSFLVGILIHRSEIPWAQVFPIRLMLRLGAEFRYYPCPLVSVRFREPVYYEIGHTIIKLLADFRNLSYTLPNIRGLKIHIEAKQASILIPRNRYDQIIRALNNSDEAVLVLAGNFSQEADAHLVCMQSKGEEITYKTQTININDKPRKITGASFVVLNGALKSTCGLSMKSSFVEDGLLVQVPNETMSVLRNKLRNMEDWSVKCGPNEGDGREEVVKIVWCEDDKNFNIGVKSIIDNMALDGIPSIRTHNFADCLGSTKLIRWTQVFIIKCEDGATSAKIGDPLEVNKLSESIARATGIALKKLLDLLAASGLTVLAVRATIDQDNVGYEAGSNGEKLPPIYMNSLDNELIPVLHKAASLNDSAAVLELIFHILDH